MRTTKTSLAKALRDFSAVSFLLLQVSKPVVAQSTVSNSVEPPKPLHQINVRSFNDSWGGGFTPIKDDGRTFGGCVEWKTLERGGTQSSAFMQWSSLTDRFGENPSRLDELQVSYKKRLYSWEDHFSWSAELGGFAVGNLGSEGIQNWVHEAAGVSGFDMPYSSTLSVYGLLGTELSSQWQLYHGESVNWEVSPKALYQWAPDYIQNFDAQVALQFANRRRDGMSLSLGYQYSEAFYNPTRSHVANLESGVYLGYELQMGLLAYGLKVYPNNSNASSYSMGYLGLSLDLNATSGEFTSPDVLTEFGALQSSNGFYLRNLWKPWASGLDGLSLDFHYQFWTYSRSQLTDYPERMGNYQQFSAGAHYHFIKLKDGFQVLPYLSLRLGYKAEKTYGGETTGPSYSAPSINLLPEAGLRFKLPGNFLHAHCVYGFTLNYQYAQTLWSQIPSGMNADGEFGQSKGYGGMGGFVQIDL